MVARGQGFNLEIMGECSVQQIFNITEPGGKKGAPKKMIQVAGARVHDGELDASLKFRIIREGECIIEGLTIHSLKKFKKDAKKVEKGHECGISLNGLRNGVELQEGDTLECYKEKPADPEKFDFTEGLRSSF